MKVLVFGNSGSGKSTYARALAARESLAHLDLDSIGWEPGKLAVQRQRESVEASLRNFIDSHAAWLIARYWFSSPPGSMRAWQTISSGPGSHISTLRLNFKTPCLVSFRSGWRVIINEPMRGHIVFIVKSSIPSQVQR